MSYPGQTEDRPKTVYVKACPPWCGMFDCARCWEAGIALMEGNEVKRYGGRYGYNRDDDEDDADSSYERENDIAAAFAKSEGERGYLKRCRDYMWRWEDF